MTRVTGVPLAGAALLLAGAVTAAAQRADLTAVRRAIDGQNVARAAAVKQGDAAALARIFADSGVQVGMRVGKIWKGRSAIEQRFRADFADGRRADEVVVQSDEVLLDGATAVEYGHYAYHYPPHATDPAVNIAGKYVVVWRQQADGTWRILMDAGIPPS